MAENKHGIEELGDRVRPLIIPSPALATMRIAAPEVAGGYMIINVSDFDASTMTEYRAAKSGKARE